MAAKQVFITWPVSPLSLTSFLPSTLVEQKRKPAALGRQRRGSAQAGLFVDTSLVSKMKVSNIAPLSGRSLG
jgi:hypothetical protein